jgi:hypothetical protein
MGALVVLLAAARIPLLIAARQDSLASTIQALAIAVPLAAIGVLVARRRPGNPIGWLMVALPAGIGVGILKFRLYDIDRIISRTLAYTIVTGLLAGVLFNPLRRRVQLAVDRRFNRARYDADQAVAAFADRLKEAVDLDSVRDDLAGVVQHALEPAHISVWVSRR